MGAKLWASETLLALAVLFAGHSLAHGTVSVIIKPNPTDKAESMVFLKDSSTGKTREFIALRDVNSSHYHPASYIGGYLYVITRPGGSTAYETDPNWTDELWRYDQDGKGVKLWSGRGLDFRVRSDGSLIAVLSPESDSHRHSLHLLTPAGQLAKTYTWKQLGAQDLDFGKWDGRFLWLRDQETIEIYGFIRIDPHSSAFRRYDVSQLNLTNSDYALDTDALRLAYSDYPVFFDTDSLADFERRKTPVKLYVYDLTTKKRRLIARSVAQPFKPKWVTSSKLEYDNPKGRGRVRKRFP